MFSGITAQARFACKISAVSSYGLGDPAAPILNLLPHQSSSQEVPPSTESQGDTGTGDGKGQAGCLTMIRPVTYRGGSTSG